jgi:tripartite-type tricarboxylate transporter receptor subunit TctC
MSVFCFVLVLVLTTIFAEYAASADPVQSYPRKSVRLIVGPAAGGPTDRLARRLSSKLEQLWGQTVLVDNRPGAGNTIATTLAARATPDGYTLLLCPLSDAIAPAVYSGLRYNFLKDIIAISRIGTTANIFVAHPSLPIKSVRQFIEYTKMHPGGLNYAAQGIAQAGHLSMELLKSMAGKIDVVYVPYKGSGLAKADLLAGRVHVQITNLPSYLPDVRSGKLRALAVTTPKRDRRLPEVPAISETLPGFDVTTWYGICAPSGVPKRLVNRINADMVQLLNAPDPRAQLERDGVDPLPSTPEEFASLLKAEAMKWKSIVRSIGIPVQTLAN